MARFDSCFTTGQLIACKGLLIDVVRVLWTLTEDVR